MSGGAYILLDSGAAPAPTPSAIGAILTTRAPDAYKHTVSYRTNIISSANGTERRRALRFYPREKYEATYRIDDAEAFNLRILLFTKPATPILIPEEHEAVVAQSDASTTVQVDLSLSDAFNVGDSVLVRNGDDEAFGAVITAVTPGSPYSTLTLDNSPPIGVTFPAQWSHVIPLREIQMADGQPLARYALGDGSLTVTGTATKNRTIYGTGAALTTFDSLPVVTPGLERPDGGEGVSEAMNGELVVIDYGGTFEVKTDRTHPLIQRPHTFTIDGPADRQWWKLFLKTMLGKQGRCLLPTARSDFALSVQPAPGATAILFTSEGDFAGTWFADGFVYVAAHHADGSVEYWKASAAVDNGNGTQTVTIGAPGASGTAVDYVSLLETARLDADEFPFDWSPGIVTELATVFATILTP